jgi:hypothetical protein
MRSSSPAFISLFGTKNLPCSAAAAACLLVTRDCRASPPALAPFAADKGPRTEWAAFVRRNDSSCIVGCAGAISPAPTERESRRACSGVFGVAALAFSICSCACWNCSGDIAPLPRPMAPSFMITVDAALLRAHTRHALGELLRLFPAPVLHSEQPTGTEGEYVHVRAASESMVTILNSQAQLGSGPRRHSCVASFSADSTKRAMLPGARSSSYIPSAPNSHLQTKIRPLMIFFFCQRPPNSLPSLPRGVLLTAQSQSGQHPRQGCRFTYQLKY